MKRQEKFDFRFAITIKNIRLHPLVFCVINVYPPKSADFFEIDSESIRERLMEATELKSAISDLAARIEKIRDWL